jgi:GT2 family glycosyltransferase
MTEPYIDIIVLSYQKYRTTTKVCLETIIPQLNDENYRLTIIDNGSPDGSGALILRDYYKQSHVRTVVLNDNLGFAGGMNHGAAIATGEWLLLVNSDTKFLPGTLKSLEELLRTQPCDVGMVGPITNSAGTAQGYGFCVDDAKAISLADSIIRSPSGQLIPAYRLDFFCVAIRRTLWERLDGLDTIYGLGYYEDFDFSLRATEIGTKMYITEDVFVFHLGGESFTTQLGVKELIKRNKRLIREKFPQVMFHHQREDTYRVLQFYATLRCDKKWSPALEKRAKLRVKSLLDSLPKGPIKKLFWLLRIEMVCRTLRLRYKRY